MSAKPISYADVFHEIYATKRGGYGSGGGSCDASAWPYSRLIERLLLQYQPSMVLDIGCGDGQVASAINWGSVHYIGIDVTQEPLTLHRSWRPSSDLRIVDALNDTLPDADLVLTKEATQHMDLESISLLLSRLRKYRRVLHTSVIQSITNCEIAPGDCRTVDLSMPPFSLNVRTLLHWQCGDGGKFLTQLWEPNG